MPRREPREKGLVVCELCGALSRTKHAGALAMFTCRVPTKVWRRLRPEKRKYRWEDTREEVTINVKHTVCDRCRAGTLALPGGDAILWQRVGEKAAPKPKAEPKPQVRKRQQAGVE